MNNTYIGRLGRDIELRAAGSTTVANFSIAMNRKVKGEDQTTWLRVVAFGELAENLAAAAGKGDRVIIVGDLQENSWTDREGNERKTIELIANDGGVALRWSRGGSVAPAADDSFGGGDPF